MFSKLVYTSKISKKMNYQEFRELSDTSAKNNAELDITGKIYFNRDSFFQILEGGRVFVDHLFQIISKDKRHKNIKVLSRYEGTSRLYPTWSMAFKFTEDRDYSQLEELFNAEEDGDKKVLPCLNFLETS